MFIYLHWINTQGPRAFAFHNEKNAASYVFDAIAKKLPNSLSKKKAKEVPEYVDQVLAQPRPHIIEEFPWNNQHPIHIGVPRPPVENVIHHYDEMITRSDINPSQVKEIANVQDFIKNTKERTVASANGLIELWEAYALIGFEYKTIAHSLKDIRTYETAQQ